MTDSNTPPPVSMRWVHYAGWAVGVVLVLVILLIAVVALLAHRASQGAAAEIALLKAGGDPVSLADLEPAPILESENGARDIEAAIALLPNLTPQEKSLIDRFEPLDDSTPSADTAPLRAAVDRCRPALDLLPAGLAKERFSYRRSPKPVDQEMFAPDLTGLRQSARLMCRASSLAAIDGKADAAFAWAVAIFRLGDTLAAEPMYTTQLVAVAIHSIARAQAERVIGHASVSPAALRDLSRRCAAMPDRLRKDLATTLRGERAAFLTRTDNMMRNGSMSTQPVSGKRSMNVPLRMILSANQAAFIRVTRDWIAQVKNPSVTLTTKGLQVPPLRRYEQIFAGSVLNQYSMMMPSNYVGSCAYMRTAAIGLEVAARIAEGGSAPQDLSSFDAPLATDPYTGKPLLTSTDGTAWLIYSVGKNGRDDGGVSENAKPDVTGKKGDDIAFTVPLKPAGAR